MTEVELDLIWDSLDRLEANAHFITWLDTKAVRQEAKHAKSIVEKETEKFWNS